MAEPHTTVDDLINVNSGEDSTDSMSVKDMKDLFHDMMGILRAQSENMAKLEQSVHVHTDSLLHLEHKVSHLEDSHTPNQTFLNKTNPFLTESPMTSPVKSSAIMIHTPYLTPRDIPILELSQLTGLETESRLERFFSQIEGCVSTDKERIQIAQTRVDTAIATFIQTSISKGRITD